MREGVHHDDTMQALGDTFDMHYDKDNGSLKYIVWVASYMHLCAPFFDYFLCDSTHGIRCDGLFTDSLRLHLP